MAVTEDTGPRALIAQWRAHVPEKFGQGYGDWHQGRIDCADELDAALTPLADLEAEMRRFAETYRVVGKAYSPAGQQALAWAETLKGLR